MNIYGSCHCGNISFKLDWEPSPTKIQARSCDCSFCVKHGGVWTSSPNGRLQVVIKDSSLVSKYAFGTGTADFHVCGRCGVVPVVTSEVEDNLYAVVNVNAFNNVDPSLLQRSPASFDGEEVTSRLARRKHNWIPKVQFVQP